VPELLEAGAAGLLVSPQAPQEIAAALVKMLSDPQTLAAWRARSQVNLQHLSLRRVVADTLEVYREVWRPARSARAEPVAAPGASARG
jgi:glycosyltransferase involved in cell wall biosynthesis